MSLFSDLIKSYAEGRGVQAFGPGWREKIAQLQAQVEQTQASTRHTNAETIDTGVQTEGHRIGNKNDQFKYDEARAKSERIKKLVDSGYIPVQDAEALAMHDSVDANTRANRDANPNAPGSAANLNVHHAGFFDRSPAETGAGGMPKGTRLVQGRNGVYEWISPGQTEGIQTHVGIKPTDAQLSRVNDLEEAVRGARILDGMYNNPAAGHEVHQGWGGAARRAVRNVPILGGAVNTEADLEADRQSTASLLNRVYALSGKQINEQEFQRLSSLLPNRGNQPQLNKVNARAFRAEMERISSRWNRLLQSGLSEEQAISFVQADNSGDQPQGGAGAGAQAQPPDLGGALDGIFGKRQ